MALDSFDASLQCGYHERFAQQALGHKSKAVHHAYSKHAEVRVPSLDDWEKQWKKDPHGMKQPKVVAVDFQSNQNGPGSADAEGPVAAGHKQARQKSGRGDRPVGGGAKDSAGATAKSGGS